MTQYPQMAAISILALTVTVALRKPRIWRLRITHAESALIGAVVTVALGIVPVALAFNTLRFLAAPVATIISLMIITLVAEEVGLFQRLAQYIAHAAQGRPRVLFNYIFLTGSITGAIFTNDAAVLIFTPLVFNLIEEIQTESWTIRQKIPFYFAVLYVANVAGILVISNPINIVAAKLFDISFTEYLVWMVAPALASIGISYLGLRICFRKQLPAEFRQPTVTRVDRAQRRVMLLCGIVLGITLLLLTCEELTGLPTWLVTCCAALLMVAIHGVLCGSRPVLFVRRVGWDVIAFVVGIYIVAVGVRNAGLAQQLGTWMAQTSGGDFVGLTHVTAITAGTLSAVMNNHPTVDTMSFAIQDLDLPALQTKLLVFAALIGGDLGPKMLPTGSLAALMWFRMLQTRGVDISYWLYVLIGIPVSLCAIFAAVLVLNFEAYLYQHFF
jgi:arsenical pump membrane protein